MHEVHLYYNEQASRVPSGIFTNLYFPKNAYDFEVYSLIEDEENPDTAPLLLLKKILAHLRDPAALNDHPWAIQIHLNARQHLQSGQPSAGEQLVKMVESVFRKMLPINPPRKGKRLDTRWGVFGILAAQYFAPLIRGTSLPTSLREAWDSLDDSILLFVYSPGQEHTEAELARYRFAGNEPEPAANSTLSDWHHKGLEELASLVNSEQKRLKASQRPAPARHKIAWLAGIGMGLLFVVMAAWFGWTMWKLVQQVQALEIKANALQASLHPTPTLEKIPEFAGNVHSLRIDLDLFQTDVEPYLWITPYLGWIPKYGGTISQAEPVLVLVQNLVTAADEGLAAVTPAVKLAIANDKPLEVMELLIQLQSAHPQLLNAQIGLAQAQAARKKINIELLIPKIKNIVAGQIDPLFTTLSGTFPMEDALTMVNIAPTLLGGNKAGPQTYLILIQNEDEMRPTGGFLTAAGSAVVMDGKVISMNIESSDLLDDFEKPYPSSPWQLKKFMNIDMMLLRDSNWFTNFPTTAAWAEYFYSYARSASADGIIAIDMHVIVRLLEALGPVSVDNVSYPISHENVLDYLRSAEQLPPEGVTGTWDRKKFISALAKPLLEKVLNARRATWTQLMPVIIELLDEKHILLQFDNEQATALLQRRNWDGAVRIPSNSDFLLSIDTNMGYNKSNTVLETTFDYTVDLKDPAAPSAVFIVNQANRASLDLVCEPFSADRFLRQLAPEGKIYDPVYTINACHWGYLRIYTPAGTTLLRSNPRQIPAEATMFNKAIPARSDNLGSEDILGAQVFGMMVLTPTRQSSNTRFEYSLPAAVLTQKADTKFWSYHLKIQKQPGMLAPPLQLTLRLPAGARIESASIPLIENAGAWTAQLDLRLDLSIEVVFSEN